VPGDEIAYVNQRLSVNGQPVVSASLGENYDEDSLRYVPMFREKLGAVEHQILVNPQQPSYFGTLPKNFPLPRTADTVPKASPARCRRATTS